jgi:ribosomal protein L35
VLSRRPSRASIFALPKAWSDALVIPLMMKTMRGAAARVCVRGSLRYATLRSGRQFILETIPGVPKQKCHPDRSGGICGAPLGSRAGPPFSFCRKLGLTHLVIPLMMKTMRGAAARVCVRGSLRYATLRSGRQFILETIPGVPKQNCHPDRSGGICGAPLGLPKFWSSHADSAGA